MRYVVLFVGIALSLFLSACGDTDNSEPPAELKPIHATLDLNERWSDLSEKGVGDQYLFLTPLATAGRVVVAGRDGAVKTMSLKDGDVTNSINLDATISAGIGGDDKLWLFATRDARVIAVNAETGKVLWSSRVPSEVLARPLLYRGSVLVRTVDGQILSLDAKDGSVHWSYKQVLPSLTLRGNSEPVLAGDRIFVGLDNGRLIALATDTGDVLWDIVLTVPEGRSEIQRLVDIDGQPELYGHTLYAVSYQGRLVAIDVDHGQFLWSRPFSSYSGITMDDRALYSTDDHGHVWAIDRNTGATLWVQKALTARQVTRPVLMGNDYLVVGDYDGYLHVMSRFDGHFVGRVRVGDDDDFENTHVNYGILVPPEVINNQLVVTTRDGGVYAYTYKNIDPTEASQ
jgi:outer membrane protein assembly factor BamB